MSTMMYPGAAPPGPGFDPGGGATPAPPPDPQMLMALLAGGGQGAPPGPDLGPDAGAMGGPPMGGPEGPDLGGLAGGPGADAGAGPGSPDESGGPMSAVEHIRAAMRHLMMAVTEEQDDPRTHGILKGMGALQGLLAEHAKNKAATAVRSGG